MFDHNIAAKQLVSPFLCDELLLGSRGHHNHDLFDFVQELLGGLLADGLLDEGPLADGLLLHLFVELMLVLEAVVGEMDHKFVLALHVLLGVVLDGKPQVPGVEEGEARAGVVKQVAPDIKFFVVEQERFDVVLDQAVLLQMAVL